MGSRKRETSEDGQGGSVVPGRLGVGAETLPHLYAPPFTSISNDGLETAHIA